MSNTFYVMDYHGQKEGQCDSIVNYLHNNNCQTQVLSFRYMGGVILSPNMDQLRSSFDYPSTIVIAGGSAIDAIRAIPRSPIKELIYQRHFNGLLICAGSMIAPRLYSDIEFVRGDINGRYPHRLYPPDILGQASELYERYQNFEGPLGMPCRTIGPLVLNSKKQSIEPTPRFPLQLANVTHNLLGDYNKKTLYLPYMDGSFSEVLHHNFYSVDKVGVFEHDFEITDFRKITREYKCPPAMIFQRPYAPYGEPRSGGVFSSGVHFEMNFESVEDIIAKGFTNGLPEDEMQKLGSADNVANRLEFDKELIKLLKKPRI